MSSTYSSNNGVPLCQRCSVPLAANDLRCANCGYYNATLAENSIQRNQQPPVWKRPDQQSFHHESQRNQSQQHQDGGLLKRYPTQAEQSNRYAPPSSFQAAPQPQVVPRPVSSRLPPNGGYQQNVTQPVSPFSTGPTTPPTSFGASFNQAPPPTYTQAPRSFHENPVKRQHHNVGRTVGVLILLLVIVGGSFLAYTFLFTHKNVQQTTHNASSTTSSAPQGTPLFQDNFTNNTNGWSIQSYPGEFSVALGNGTLKLENDNNKLLWELVPGGKNYGDFRLSVDAVLSKGSQDNGYGVYIRGALSQNTSITTFYRFELYGDSSFAVFKGATDANGTVTTPRLVDYTNNSAIQKQGSLNHITINAKGSSLQFIVNGQTVSTVSDATYTSGSAALFVSNLQKAPPGAEATFSHLAIYPAQS